MLFQFSCIVEEKKLQNFNPPIVVQCVYSELILLMELY